MATKKGGTNVISAITTFTDADQYPTAFADEIQGGMHSVASVTDRNAIPVGRRKLGMHCQVVGGKEYVLISDAGGTLTLDSDWTVLVPSASDIKTADGTTVETAIGNLNTATANKQAVFAIMHTDVQTGVFVNEFCNPYKGSVVSLFANVPVGTVLTKDATAQLEYLSGNTWTVVDKVTIPVGSASMYATKGITPLPINALDRLRINITSIQDGIESLNVYVGIKATN